MRTNQPLVSIITPVYNGQEYLAELIESVGEQAYPNIEHIIIDDGSTDEGATLAILKQYAHLRWWSRENRGRFATMNEGLEAAKGEVVCIVNADDMLMPGAVGHVIEYLEQHPEYDGVVGLTQFVNEAGAPYANAPFQTAPVRYYAYLSQISHCSLYLKRECLLRCGLLFDPSLHYVGDYDWILRILAVLSVGRVDFHLSKFRVHATQTSRRNRRAMVEEQKRVVAAHHINPVLFTICKSFVIGVHDAKKLGCTWANSGPKGAWQLIASHLQHSA
jgi:glycosyltransferase involved in cell wall biosynthesis